MKDFMMIFVGQEYEDLGLSPEEMQNRMGKWFAWHGEMEQKGIVKHGDALKPGVRRISGPNRTVTDTNATELKEVIGGYYIITVKDFETACEVAQGFPDFDLGSSVEVREVMVFDNN